MIAELVALVGIAIVPFVDNVIVVVYFCFLHNQQSLEHKNLYEHMVVVANESVVVVVAADDEAVVAAADDVAVVVVAAADDVAYY